MGYTTKEIVELMEKAAELRVSIEVKDENFSVNINGRGNTASECAPAVSAPAVSAPQLSAPCEDTGTAIKSPIVGTFYSSASPDKAPFVKVGQAVKKGDVLFIIESMKLMNEVQSECDGVVKEIIAQSGQAVEYGQVILVLE